MGLLHDFDYEMFPAADQHPFTGSNILCGRGYSERIIKAILGHATYTGVPRDTMMARALFATDELCGFLVACALVRPTKSLDDQEVSSVKKKLKDKAFARSVNRDDIRQGVLELEVDLDEHIRFVIDALRPLQEEIGLKRSKVNDNLRDHVCGTGVGGIGLRRELAIEAMTNAAIVRTTESTAVKNACIFLRRAVCRYTKIVASRQLPIGKSRDCEQQWTR